MAQLPRFLVLIGSGEMAAQMARVHRQVIGRIAATLEPHERVAAAIIDTPYGFQENAESLSAEALDFFGRRMGLEANLASLLRADADAVVRENAYARVREAQFVFSGPGSPSYALTQWSATELPSLFADKLLNGGALVFASAAALTLGRFTAPIYEIYKAGDEPRWLPGLDVLASIGLSAAVIPHWDNSDGTNHDTRYCFLGRRRFEHLENELPPDVFVLGIDEHTALVIDIDRGIADVRGRGAITIRQRGAETVHRAGSEFRLDTLASAADAPAERGPNSTTGAGPSTIEARLARDLVALQHESDALGRRAALAEPLVQELLRLRAEARAMGVYEVADQIRDRLADLGVEVTDVADGHAEFRLPD
jgi:hypothetical protein